MSCNWPRDQWSQRDILALGERDVVTEGLVAASEHATRGAAGDVLALGDSAREVLQEAQARARTEDRHDAADNLLR